MPVLESAPFAAMPAKSRPAPLPKTPNVFVSPNRTRAAAWVPARGVIEVRSHPDGKVLHELTSGVARRVRFERDDRLVVEYGGNTRESVQVWDTTTGKPKEETLRKLKIK